MKRICEQAYVKRDMWQGICEKRRPMLQAYVKRHLSKGRPTSEMAYVTGINKKSYVK